MKLIDKHFHKNHPLNEIINRKNVNISYSCCPNNNIINSNNRRILNENTNNDEKENKTCKCKQKQNITVLSMENKCCTSCIIYKASINNEKKQQLYRNDPWQRFTLNTNILKQINKRNLQLLYPLTLGII